MKLKTIFYLLIAAQILFSCQGQVKQESDESVEATESSSTIQLFEEKEKDWQMDGDAVWLHQDGVVTGMIDTGASFLMTKASYQDFILQLEFNPDSTINSGVFTRCKDIAISPIDCFEFNIWDLHPNQDFRTGALVTKAKPLAMVETLNQWNQYKIRCEGSHIQAWINDIKMVDIQDSTLTSGFIAIQASGNGKVKFRNIQLEVLDTEE